MTVITETIGAGGDHSTIEAWLAAHTGDDLVALTTRYVGELIDDHLEVVPNAIIVSGCVTSATWYRSLKSASSTGRFQPWSNQIAKLYSQWLAGTSTETIIDVQEDNFRMTGVGLICEDPNRTGGTGGNVKCGIKINADGCRFFSTMVRISEGGSFDVGVGLDPFFRCFWVGASAADDVQFWNCQAIGSPHSKGANIGWFFDAFSTTGGVYNCSAYSITHGLGRGFLGHLSGVQDPQLINCISAGCSSDDFAGLWSLYTRNISSDESAIAEIPTGINGDGLPLSDPYSFAYQGARSLWLAPDAQDLRNRQSSIARDNGLDLSNEIKAAGAATIEDWSGQSGYREAGSWSIGPFEGFVDLPTDPPAVTVSTIGVGRDYTTIGAWLDVMEDRSIVFRNEVWIGHVYDDAEYDLGAGRLQARRCLTSAINYRELRAVDSVQQFDPVHDSGVRVTSALGSSTLALFEIDEPYFRLSGMRLESTYAGANDNRVLRIQGAFAIVDAVAVIQEAGTGVSIGCQVEGSRVQVSNSIAKGSGNGTTGLERGFRAQDCEVSRFLQCVADEIDGASATCFGFRESDRVSRIEFVNCISTASKTADFSHDPASKGATTQSNCMSSDATAEGPGAQTSVTRATIWAAPDTGAFGDYRLVATSPALNAGRNVRFWLSSDWNGSTRYAPFDLGIYEGIALTQLMAAGPWRNDLANICTLWALLREDGEGLFFTDANEPIPYRGQIHEPAGGVLPGSVRGQSGLKERSLSMTGAITSDKITAEDLAAGRYRNARVVVTIIDWKNIFAAPLHEETFWIADVEHDREVWRADPVGITQRLEDTIGGTVSVDCPYRLGDEDCEFDVSGLVFDDVRVSAIVRNLREFDGNSADLPDASTHPDDYWKWGEITWLSGPNTGTVSEVKKYTAGTRRFVLAQELPFPMASDGSDTFYLRPGCGGRYLTDCIGRWSWGQHFGGDPFMPGAEAQFQTPQR